MKENYSYLVNLSSIFNSRVVQSETSDQKPDKSKASK